MSVHQNLSKNELIVEGIEELSNPVNVEIISLNRQTIKSCKISIQNPVIDISGLHPNIYLVKLQNGKSRITRKIIIE